MRKRGKAGNAKRRSGRDGDACDHKGDLKGDVKGYGSYGRSQLRLITTSDGALQMTPLHLSVALPATCPSVFEV